MNEVIIQIQEILFKIICDIDDYCTENGIRYYLSGGTCLGAVRHQGFIPWDDDADIMMPRPDYERFMEGFSREFNNKYGVGSLNTVEKWSFPHGRVWDLSTRLENMYFDLHNMGVFVDVFPIDGLPDKRGKQKWVYKKIKFYSVLRHAAMRERFKKGEKNKFIKRILQVFCKPLGANYFSKAMQRQVINYPFDSSKFVAVTMTTKYGEKETIRQDKMKNGVELPFNGRLLPVPVGYETYLSNLYGDYMQIPKDAAGQGYTHLSNWKVVFSNKAGRD